MSETGFARVVASEVIKSAPPVAVTGATLFGLGLHEIAQLIVLGLTGVYIVYQVMFLRGRWKAAREDRRKARPE